MSSYEKSYKKFYCFKNLGRSPLYLSSVDVMAGCWRTALSNFTVTLLGTIESMDSARIAVTLLIDRIEEVGRTIDDPQFLTIASQILPTLVSFF